jgi:exocyst complex component 3
MEADTVNVKLAELLRNPDDLDKISALKSEFTRKKAAVDSQLRIGLQEQLAVTQAGMSSITEGQRTVDLIKAEMQKIDKLCAEAQNMIRDFPHINTVAQTHRNFSQVEAMRNDIEEFDERLANVEQLLKEDLADMENQPNLLAIHFELTKLRDIRDTTLDQVSNSGEAGEELVNNLQLSTGSTLADYFNRLNDAVEWFDENLWKVQTNLLEFVQAGNDSMVTRLALVVHEEEKNDKKAKALQDAQSEFKELASRFKSISTGKKEIRGYKDKFLKAIELRAATMFDECIAQFDENPDRLDKTFRWYFTDLLVVKDGMQKLMPKRWKIFQAYVQIYHKQMHDWLIARVSDPDLKPPQLLAIVAWSDKYYKNTGKLAIPEDWMRPQVIDDRGSEMIREYRLLIINAVDEWMDRMAKTDSQAFLSRDESALDTDENGCFRTKTLADMWRMLREQLEVAKSSDRTDIVEGVVDSMFRALQSRQRMWESLIDAELNKYKEPPANPTEGYQGVQGFQDWLVSIANDQIACIDDGDESEGNLAYLTRFSRDITPFVSQEYTTNALRQIDLLKDGYVDLSTHCLTVFAKLVLAVDFKPLLPEFFTQTWYQKTGMVQAITTFDDYLNDYAPVLHPSLGDILAEELSDQLLISYLGCVRNKGVKFRRNDRFMDKVKDDLVTVFKFFDKFETVDSIKEKWRVVERMFDLVVADKAEVPEVYEQLKGAYWDVGMGWVEAVLRTRDDWDRALLAGVKGKAAVMEVVRGPETIMGKVK